MSLQLRSLVVLAITALFPLTNAKADGKAIFTAQACSKCHAISAQDIKSDGDAPDLSHIGGKRSADWMAKFLMKEEAVDGKKHKKKFPGTPDELKELTQWLSTLK